MRSFCSISVTGGGGSTLASTITSPTRTWGRVGSTRSTCTDSGRVGAKCSPPTYWVELALMLAQALRPKTVRAMANTLKPRTGSAKSLRLRGG
ncbi:hypothetical protein D3C71_2006700 [compost metagenome]